MGSVGGTPGWGRMARMVVADVGEGRVGSDGGRAGWGTMAWMVVADV